MPASVAVLVGGCFIAARLGGVWGTFAALVGFAAYLVLFARGLDHLPVDWNVWRERKLREYSEETEERDDHSEVNNGGKT